MAKPMRSRRPPGPTPSSIEARERREAARAVQPPLSPEAAKRSTPRERLAKAAAFATGARGETEEGATTYGLRILDSTPLDAYLRRGKIDWRQHDAGSWLHRAFIRAVHQPSMTACYGERLGGGGGSDTGVDGRAQLWRALLHSGLAERGPVQDFVLSTRGGQVWADMRGPIQLNPMGRVAMAVCGLEEWAGGTRRLELLGRALTLLADHLRIGTQPHKPAEEYLAERGYAVGEYDYDAEGEDHREAIVCNSIRPAEEAA